MTKNGRNALLRAAEKGSADVVRVLIDAGSDVLKLGGVSIHSSSRFVLLLFVVARDSSVLRSTDVCS